MVDFIGIERVRELVARRGAARFIEELAQEIEADFVRWDAFEKSPRHASHSQVGVIELMPACDGRLYAFKYVNGHPKNTARGPADRDRLRRAGRRRDRLPAAAVRADADHRAAHRGHLARWPPAAWRGPTAASWR